MASFRELTEEKCNTGMLFARTARWFKREIVNFSRRAVLFVKKYFWKPA
jgi:hypothetical protein